MKKLIAALVGLSMAGAASAASAQSMYVTGKLGPYLPDENALDDGINVEAAVGRGFTEFFPGARGSWLDKVSLEAGVGFYTADGRENFSLVGWVDRDLFVIPATIMGIYNHSVPGTKLDLYGGAGLGLYFSSVEVRTQVEGKVVDETNLDPGLRLVGGGYYNLNPRLALGGELRFDIVPGDVEDVDLGGVAVNFSARYRF